MKTFILAFVFLAFLFANQPAYAGLYCFSSDFKVAIGTGPNSAGKIVAEVILPHMSIYELDAKMKEPMGESSTRISGIAYNQVNKDPYSTPYELEISNVKSSNGNYQITIKIPELSVDQKMDCQSISWL